MSALLTKDITEVEKPASKTPFLTVSSPSHEAVPAGTGPTASPVGPRIIGDERDCIHHYDSQQGDIIVPLHVQRWSDGMTILTFGVTTELGDHTAHAWINRNGGIAIQVKSRDTENRYTVTQRDCTCPGFQFHGYCRHTSAGRKAIAVAATWQQVQRQRAQAIWCRAYDDAMDMQHWEEVA